MTAYLSENQPIQTFHWFLWQVGSLFLCAGLFPETWATLHFFLIRCKFFRCFIPCMTNLWNILMTDIMNAEHFQVLSEVQYFLTWLIHILSSMSESKKWREFMDSRWRLRRAQHGVANAQHGVAKTPVKSPVYEAQVDQEQSTECGCWRSSRTIIRPLEATVHERKKREDEELIMLK